MLSIGALTAGGTIAAGTAWAEEPLTSTATAGVFINPAENYVHIQDIAEVTTNAITFEPGQNYLAEDFINVTSKDPETPLIEYTDYTLTLLNENGAVIDYAHNAGNYQVVIQGINGTDGTMTIDVKVDPKPLDANWVTFTPNPIEYTGNALQPSIAIADNGYVLSGPDNSDYDYKINAWSNNVQIGTASVEIEGNYNYTGKIYPTFEIVYSHTNLIVEAPAQISFAIGRKDANNVTSIISPSYTIENKSTFDATMTSSYTNGINSLIYVDNGEVTAQDNENNLAKYSISNFYSNRTVDIKAERSITETGSGTISDAAIEILQAETVDPGKPGVYLGTVDFNFTQKEAQQSGGEQGGEKIELGAAGYDVSAMNYIRDDSDKYFIMEYIKVTQGTDGEALTEGVDYEYSISPNVNEKPHEFAMEPGTYTITVTGVGDFEGQLVKTFDVSMA